ncbi:MAG: hypothetical protein EOO39_00145 [Cytophagaceae bacterium]|nr:MAG: hypothetical protein EOO39_00145 [Cytophagaceae bacterium]
MSRVKKPVHADSPAFEGGAFGITIRQYFIGQAIVGLAPTGIDQTAKEIASQAIELADELIRQLNQPEE